MRLCVAPPVAAILIVAIACTGAAATDATYPAEIVPQMGHQDFVTSVAFSPDGRFTLSGSNDKTLKLWDVATGKLLRTLKGHTESVHSVAFSPDGTRALSGSCDKTLKLWDMATGKELRSFTGHKEWVNAVAISRDGRFALSGGLDATVRLWEVATGKQLRSLSGHKYSVLSVAFSPDGRFALSGGSDRTLKLWELPAGIMVRSFLGDAGNVNSVAFSPDGRFALSASSFGAVRLWDVATGKQLRSFRGDRPVNSVAFSPDGRFVLSGSDDDTMKLWDAVTGQEERTFMVGSGGINAVAFSSDGRFAVSGGSDHGLKLWEVSTGKELRSFSGHTGAVYSAAFSPDGRFATLTAGHTLKLWDTASGRVLQSLVPDVQISRVQFFAQATDVVSSAAISPDGRFALTFGNDMMLCLWDLTTGKQLRCFSGDTAFTSVAFSPSGRLALSGSAFGPLKLWDVPKGALLRNLSGDYAVDGVAFSPDGRLALASAGPPAESDERTLMLWDVATGKQLRSLGRISVGGKSVAFSPDGRLVLAPSGDKLMLFDVAAGKEPRAFRGHSGQVESAAFSTDGRFVVSGSDDNTLKLWEVATGKEVRGLKGHTGRVWSAAFSPNGRLILSGSEDGTARIWDAGNGQELVRTVASSNGDWLTITPSGFFTASRPGTDLLAIARGLGLTASGQVYQSLFDPDLVREMLAGDPDGEVARAATVINLDKVLDSGPAPEVEITSHSTDTKSNADLVTATALIKDRGKGIGRIEWKVNGVTAAVAAKPEGDGPDYNVTQQLALDSGDNTIEVVAYNASNLLASLPGRTTIKFTGSADTVKPRLHVLAIGINAYVDQGWTPPGSTETLAFPPLHLAVSDAKALAGALKQAGAGEYADVKVTEALDANGSLASLQQIIERMASEVNPRDTFVLFAAAHGISDNGRFYLIPQDYDGGTNPAALQQRAIGQDRLQDWVANRIKAKKALILLDTCESGALVGGYVRSRTDVPASEAAVGRLHEATGRPVLTAAADGKPAFEGYEGHGVFTWAVLDALKNGDSNGDGFIELSELAAHVQDQVPKIATKLNGRGRAAVAARGLADDSQSAHFGSRGEDFVLVRRLQ